MYNRACLGGEDGEAGAAVGLEGGAAVEAEPADPDEGPADEGVDDVVLAIYADQNWSNAYTDHNWSNAGGRNGSNAGADRIYRAELLDAEAGARADGDGGGEAGEAGADVDDVAAGEVEAAGAG